MRIAAALAFIASVLVMTPEAVSAMPLTLGDHAALSRHMSTTVMQVAHRHAYARHYKRYVYTAPRRYNWLAALPLLLLAALPVWRSAVLSASSATAAKVVHDKFARTKRV